MWTRTSVTLGGAAFARVAVAVRIAALAMALTEHGRELRGEAPSGLPPTRSAQPILVASRRVHHDVAARDEASERLSHEWFIDRGEPHNAVERGRSSESLALEPVEQLEQLVFARDLAPGVSP